MIEVSHLSKKYGTHPAIEDLSFTVGDGQIFGLLGPNGAGKSTTMNIITGYISATDGTVKIDGHDIADEPAAAKACIGYLPELPPLYQDMTVQEYLLFVAELKGTRKKADRAAAVEHAVARAGLQGMEQRLIRNLSKGYRQRVGIAAALLGTPKIIILDEPTVGLDPAQMIEIRSLIRDLGKTHTVILSSHILSEVQTVCDRVLIIAHGRLVAQGTPEELAAQLTAKGTITATAQGSREAVIIAEGIHMLNPLLFDPIRDRATGIYVAPRTRIITPGDRIIHPEQVRVARRMIRNYQGRGNSLRETIIRAQSVNQGEQKYIAPNKPNASIHIDSFHDYELCILAKYLRQIPQFASDLDDTFIAEHGLTVLMDVVRSLPPLDTPYVPRDSIVREFVGGSIFQY